MERVETAQTLAARNQAAVGFSPAHRGAPVTSGRQESNRKLPASAQERGGGRQAADAKMARQARARTSQSAVKRMRRKRRDRPVRSRESKRSGLKS